MSHSPQPRPTVPLHLADETDTMSRVTPSWFPEERDRHGYADDGEAWGPSKSPPRPAMRGRATVSRAELLARERYYRNFPHEGDANAILSRRRSMRGVYVVAGLLAMFAGGATGIVFANLPTIMAKARSLSTSAAIETGGNTTITKKLVPTATLEVADVSGDLNSFIPLMLRAEPAALGEPLAIKLSGLPKGAYLTEGSRAPDESWVLNADEAARAKLVVPQSDRKSFDVAVAAVDASSGELAAPIKEMTVAIAAPNLRISPASAEPEIQAGTMPAKAAPTQVATATEPAVAEDLVRKGDSLLAAGDMESARPFYEKAFRLGAADGAYGLGRSYDPLIYKAQNVQGLLPDASLAMDWYQRAAGAGSSQAAAAIEALKASTLR